jgi:uncharacterized protein with HEPN domain
MTPTRNVLVIIDEMLDHIDYVLEKAQNKSVAEFHADRDTRQSVERSLEIISEASRHLSAELKLRKPEIPWRQIADFGISPSMPRSFGGSFSKACGRLARHSASFATQ